MINNSDKLEYLNKLPNIEYERQYLSLIVKHIDNWVTMVANTNFLNDLDIETIIGSFSDEVLEIFASLIEDYRDANCLHLLKHELKIIYHLQNFLNIFDQDEGGVSWTNNFVTDAIAKNGVRGSFTFVARAIFFTIALKTNIHRNHMINPPCEVSLGYNQFLMKNEQYCISHKNKNSKDYSCVSHVNYVATKMRNRNAILIAQTYIQQFTILGFQAATKYLTNSTNKGKTAWIANNLRNKQGCWYCYYCLALNESSRNDFCDFCQKGINPLYFSKENKSKCFTVDPYKFGIFKTQPTSSYKNVKFFGWGVFLQKRIVYTWISVVFVLFVDVLCW